MKLHFVCQECGSHVLANEYGECVTCGEGCAIEECECTKVPESRDDTLSIGGHNHDCDLHQA